MDVYTPREKTKLLKFRQLVSNILISDYQTHDSFLIRWLRARNLDLEKAEEMLRKDILWREANQVDGILDREPPQDHQFNAPFAFCGTTSEGYPIILLPLGRRNGPKFVDKYGKETSLRFAIIFMEKILKKLEMESNRQGKQVTQYVEILDLSGYSFRYLTSKVYRQYLVETTKIIEGHYPQILKESVIINAPKLFAILSALLKPFISKEIKLEVYGSHREKWKKVIREKFPINNIPPYWGGTLQGKDEFCSGNEIWLQGPPDLRPYMNGLGGSSAECSGTNVCNAN